jgi:hypothetical protein
MLYHGDKSTNTYVVTWAIDYQDDSVQEKYISYPLY